MIEQVGDSLNYLAAGVLFPLLFLPLAAIARDKKQSALIWLALVAGTLGASWLFSVLAVDLSAPKLKAVDGAVMLGSVAIIGALVALRGAPALASTISKPLGALVRGVGRLSLYLVMAMAVVQFAIVILRYVFGLNYIAMQESVTYMHGAIFLIAGGYALLTDDHVRVDVFYREAGPRMKAVVNLAGTYLFLFPFCLVALWAAGPYVANSWAVMETSIEQSGIKGVYLLKSLISVYLVLFAFAGFVVATEAVATLKGEKA